MQGNDSQENDLKPKQTRAIAALLTAKGIQSAAKEADVSEATIHRWLKDDEDFRAALRAAEAAAIGIVVSRLAGATNDALTVVVTLMNNKRLKPNIRLRAALGMLDQFVKLRQYADLEARVALLEATLGEDGK